MLGNFTGVLEVHQNKENSSKRKRKQIMEMHQKYKCYLEIHHITRLNLEIHQKDKHI